MVINRIQQKAVQISPKQVNVDESNINKQGKDLNVAGSSRSCFLLITAALLQVCLRSSTGWATPLISYSRWPSSSPWLPAEAAGWCTTSCRVSGLKLLSHTSSYFRKSYDDVRLVIICLFLRKDCFCLFACFVWVSRVSQSFQHCWLFFFISLPVWRI